MIFRRGGFPLYTTKEDIDFLGEMVKKSPYVACNSDYRKKADDTKVTFASNEDLVNAYAQSFDDTSHKITMLNGICNASKLMGVALAYFNKNPDKKSAAGRLALSCRWIGNEIIDNNYKCPVSLIRKGLKDLCYKTDGMIGIDAKSYAAGGILAIVGHEQGHICLSHTLQGGDYSDEMSRNNERQADLFGCNVSVTTPFATHIVLATLFGEVLFNWMIGNEQIATTHPHSRERVFNTIRAHDTILAELGITEDNIHWFIPPEDPESEESEETSEE